MEPRWLGTSYPHPDHQPDARLKRMGLTREQYVEMVRERALRDEIAPKVGAPAPDFQAERLTPAGKRSGKMFRLSSMRGSPVALVFGSYT